MKIANRVFNVRIKRNRLQAAERISYQSIANGLVSKMVDSVRSTDTRKFGPPLRLVIIDRRGTVVFQCQVGRDGNVRPSGPSRKVWLSHFPANALLTDRSLVTRTFLIERPAHRHFQH
jgi:hypothetical protein